MQSSINELEYEMSNFIGPIRRGVARIGRSGTKLHPVSEQMLQRAGGEYIKYLNFSCCCTGTANGRAHNNAQVFWGNTAANCGNR